uniref:EF-hand domain-containing protein n=1 Tax=Lotharella oceanica TaxID=641309 RepID=A0A7S2X773_9EUKA|mmetsp:Transcript_15947/g.30263  ORF Transcript_15947/g.30263 Transcript_15947/m.30263 type:complete len:508 (+) Transcript_15947:62-1585(+)
MSRTVEEIASDLKFQIARRGGSNISSVARAFAVNDTNGDGLFDFDEFELVLGRSGMFVSKTELKQVFRYCDKDKSGKLSYNEFLELLSPKLSGRRKKIALQAFDAFDKTGDGVVNLDDLKGVFDASKHPKVQTGEMTEEMVFKQFLNKFEGKDLKESDGKITKDEFLDYMADLSSNFPFNDDAFVQMVENAWKVTEDQESLRAVDQKTIEAFKKEIREKVRQRTKGTKYERDTLAFAFKHFDLDGSGKIIFQEFQKALAILGVQPDERVGLALFNNFDVSKNGAITYNELADTLFNEDNPDFNKSMLASIGNSKKQPVVLFVVGGPGTGKGTQSAKVVAEFGFKHLSTGDLLRAERKREGSKYGELINKIIAEGKLVPSDLTVSLLVNAIDDAIKTGSRYFLVDGFPRSIENLDAWEKFASEKAAIAGTICFTCDEAIMVERLLARAKTSGRSDDNKETIQKRLKTFKESQMPVLKVLKVMGGLHNVDCAASVEKVIWELVICHAGK